MAAVSTCKDILRVAFRKFLMNPTDMKNYVLLQINKKTGGKSQLNIVQFNTLFQNTNPATGLWITFEEYFLSSRYLLC